jgi:hypothetical protein
MVSEERAGDGGGQVVRWTLPEHVCLWRFITGAARELVTCGGVGLSDVTVRYENCFAVLQEENKESDSVTFGGH